MKTAHEILAEEALARQQHEAEEALWSRLVSRCRQPRGQMPFAAQMILSAVLLAALAWVSPPNDHRGLYVVGAFVVFVFVPMHFFQLWRRERVLRTVIQRYAPELHQRLEREHVA